MVSVRALAMAALVSVACSRSSGSPSGVVALVSIPPLPPGPAGLPTWSELCLDQPRSRYADWNEALVITPANRCYKDWRRRTPRIIFDPECGQPGEPCGQPIQCPAPGTSLVRACPL